MKKKEETKNVSIEKMFENLEKIVAKMENGDNSLEENFELYKKGYDICKALNEKVDSVAQKFTEVEK